MEAEDGIRDTLESRGVGDVYKNQTPSNARRGGRSGNVGGVAVVRTANGAKEVRHADERREEKKGSVQTDAFAKAGRVGGGRGAVAYIHLTLPT